MIDILTDEQIRSKIRRNLSSLRYEKNKLYADHTINYKAALEKEGPPPTKPVKPRSLQEGLLFPKGFENRYPNIVRNIERDIRNENGFNYFIKGNVGSGKTYLAFIIAQTLKAIYREDVKWFNCDDAYYDYLHIRESSTTNKSKLLSNATSLLNGRFVVLDDVGTESPSTAAAHSYINKIIADRYNRYKRGVAPVTIFTSNLDGTKIDEIYGSRLLRRIHEMCTVIEVVDAGFHKKKAEVWTDG